MATAFIRRFCRGTDGNLYGTAVQGGANNFGTIFELSKDSNGNFTIFNLAGGKIHR